MRFVLLFICLLFFFPGFSQSPEEETDSTQNVQVIAFPIVFYLPQTSLGLGAGGMMTFRLPLESDTTRPSSLQFGVAYTLNQQILLYLPFELYKKEEQWKAVGELGYYKYFYYFYGKGITTEKEDVETYDVLFPRVKLEILRRFRKVFFAGINFWYDGFNITEITPNGIIETQKLTSYKGGDVSGMGLTLQYDSRNHLFHPTSGAFVDYKISRFQRFIGSDFDYTRSTLSASYYHSMTDSLDVLAFNLVLQNAFGQVPFFDYAYFGSPKVLRGFNDRRFTDENMVAIQAEWRKQLWRRFGSVLFAGAGTVAGQPFGLLSNTLRTAAGVGIRYLINKEDRVFLRLDYGLTTEGGNFYLTVNQAF